MFHFLNVNSLTSIFRSSTSQLTNLLSDFNIPEDTF